MNTVVGSVAKTFLRKGYRVIGLHEGYTGLFIPDPRTVDIDYQMADGIFNQGGSFLQMSRFKPKDSDFENNFNLKFFTDNNVKLLVTIRLRRPTALPSSSKRKGIRLPISTFRRPSTMTSRFRTVHRLSVTNRLKTRVP